MHYAKPCHACGSPTAELDLRDVHRDVAALLEVRDGALVCRWCEGRAERELDDAELAADPDFATVCDARRDAWIEALERDTAAQWEAVAPI